jgi:2-polyprenyl-3-methyl-5-hydroxy-6-metoxy-1,4-benzoquinol methylase
VTRIEVPTAHQLEEAWEAGQAIGYRGPGIYVRYAAILQILAGLDADRILVIGCGHGIFDRLLPPTANVVGVDIGEEEIENARRWAYEHRPNFRYVLGRVEELDMSPEWADITILSEVLEHMPEAESGRLLQAAVGLTKRKGRILVTVPNERQLRNRARALVGRPPIFMDPDHDREYTLQSARAAIIGVGLEIVDEGGAVLYGPFETWVQRVVPSDSSLRSSIASRWPTVASHLIFLCARPAHSSG